MNNPYVKTAVLCAGPQCPRVKGQTNHWFVLLPQGSVFVADPRADLTVCDELPLYIVMAYNEKLLAIPRALPVCGEECLGKLQSELLQQSKKEGV